MYIVQGFLADLRPLSTFYIHIWLADSTLLQAILATHWMVFFYDHILQMYIVHTVDYQALPDAASNHSNNFVCFNVHCHSNNTH